MCLFARQLAEELPGFGGAGFPAEALGALAAAGGEIGAQAGRGEQADQRIAQFLQAAGIHQQGRVARRFPGSEETFEVTTGTPAAMACATGNPKPSYSDG